MINWFVNALHEYSGMLLEGLGQTLYMSIVSTFFAYLLGLPLGILVVVTSKNGIAPKRILNMVLGWIVNIGRSIPFIILLVALMPFTREYWFDSCDCTACHCSGPLYCKVGGNLLAGVGCRGDRSGKSNGGEQLADRI